MVLLLVLACGPAAGDSANGETLYSNTCASCHGADGQLGVKVADVPSADLTLEVPDQTDAQLTDVMMSGYGQMGPQFTDTQDAADCLAYLRATFK